MPSAPGPSSPAAIAPAMRSKITRARNSVVVLRPRERRLVVEVPEVQRRRAPSRSTVGRAADVDDDAVGSSSRPAELDVDDVSGAVQPLRRAEDLAGEAVGDHEVVADRHAVHESALRSSASTMATSDSGRRDRARSASRRRASATAITVGQVVERASPVISASSAGSASSAARARMPACGSQRARCAGATGPTCDDLSVRRRA